LIERRFADAKPFGYSSLGEPPTDELTNIILTPSKLRTRPPPRNIFAGLVKPNGNPAVHSALAEIPTANVFLSVVIVGEIARRWSTTPKSR
jgi:hypothetical protein